MYCWKIAVMALAAFTIALPSNLSQRLADSHEMKAFALIEGTNNPTHSRLDSRGFETEDKAEKNRREWRDLYWPEKERRHWPPPLLHDFQSIIMPHPPPGISLPSPLLPTNNVTLMNDVYIPAAARAKMEELKSTSRKKLDLEQLKKSAENFMLASRCLHLKDCKTYKGTLAVDLNAWEDYGDVTDAGKGFHKSMSAFTINEWQNRRMNKALFKERVYDPLVAEVENQTIKEGLVNLGKQLKALGFPSDEY